MRIDHRLQAFEKLCDELADFEIFDSDHEDKHLFAAGYAAGQSERDVPKPLYEKKKQ